MKLVNVAHMRDMVVKCWECGSFLSNTECKSKEFIYNEITKKLVCIKCFNESTLYSKEYIIVRDNGMILEI